MRSIKFELEEEVVVINPLHVVYAKQVGNKLFVKLTDGTSFEKEYDDPESAKQVLGVGGLGLEHRVAPALRTISPDK